MPASATRIWTSARVVALAIIAILAQAWPTSGSGLGQTRSRSPTARRPAICFPEECDYVTESKRQPKRTRSECCPRYVAARTTATGVSEVEIP
jgi:hypothetical protein